MRSPTFTLLVALWPVCSLQTHGVTRGLPTYKETPTLHRKEPFYPRRYIPVPTVEVYQQVEGRERVLVVCQFGTKTSRSSFQLSVTEGKSSYMLYDPACTVEFVCMFNATVSPPASFSCMHGLNRPDASPAQFSETYFYHPQEVSNQPVPAVSPFYIGFASLIGVCLIVMVIVMVVTTLRTRHKGSRREAQESAYEKLPLGRHE
ncbi:uncharacterized protein LOC118812968 [Colossoma macropomum]|uniref:uncharacterized protein LOC118812968 n=1 Tax=Colossoma macropomum TaxID=42526 RepID=UPI00186449CF|nr:uncharacterized protein LOC118812968 [Colossoma macropomum]